MNQLTAVNVSLLIVFEWKSIPINKGNKQHQRTDILN